MNSTLDSTADGTISCRLIPALDLLEGRAVRLLRGDYQRQTDYGDPGHWLARWWEQGAREIHIVDLAGARDGRCSVLELLSQWASQGWTIQLGGGLRDLAGIQAAMDAGVTRAVLGTAAVDDTDFLAACIQKFGSAHIVGGLDLRDGIPQSSGWLKESRWSLQDLLDHWKNAGLQWVLSTSVLKDGTLEGPDLEQYRILREALPACSIIASGGLRHRADLMALGALQIEAAVAGRALLDGLFKTDGLWR